MDSTTNWPMDKDVKDFMELVKNLRLEGQSSRADAVDYLIERIIRLERNTVIINFEDKDTVQWIMGNFVENIFRSYDGDIFSTPAKVRAMQYYDDVMKQISYPKWTED